MEQRRQLATAIVIGMAILLFFLLWWFWPEVIEWVHSHSLWID
jgi:hypothetical protein